MSDLTEAFEMHAVWADGDAKKEWVSVREAGDGISISANYGNPTLRPAQARYLARKLYRLARRVDKRAEGEL